MFNLASCKPVEIEKSDKRDGLLAFVVAATVYVGMV